LAAAGSCGATAGHVAGSATRPGTGANLFAKEDADLPEILAGATDLLFEQAVDQQTRADRQRE
jgi:hypothetical protein